MVHTKTNLPIDKNGYLYIFVSNETPNIDVFFDNLQITHEHGPLLQEDHYYPFGMGMAGISSSRLPAYVPNRYKANAGAELGFGEWADGSGLELYETFYRSYNAQIGRFMQVDPLAEMAVTDGGYVYGGNNPVRFTDYLGDRKAPGHYGFWPGPRPYVHQSYSYVDRNGNKWHHRDFMAGTGAEGIPYYLYQEAMSQIPDGGSSGGLSFEGGKWGLRFGYWVDGEDAHGHYNEEMKLMMGFSPFRIGWQYRQTYVGAGNGAYYQTTSQEMSNWENAGIVLVATDIVPSTVEMGTEIIRKTANYSDDIRRVAKFSSKASKSLGYLGVGLTIADGLTSRQGWKPHHTADAIIGTVQTALLGAGTIG